MAINYTHDKKLNILGEILGEYQTWYSSVIQHVFYQGGMPAAPETFSSWLQDVSFEKIDIEGRYLQEKTNLLAVHEKVVQAAAPLNASSAEEFSGFSEQFKELLAGVHGLCQAIILEQGGLDILTGLKNNAVIEADLSIEMERLSREGYPFCIGLARIDDFKNVDDGFKPEQADELVKTVAGFIQQSLRSYDDAYRVSRDHFMMCLKQSDMVGGQKALERLRDILEGAGEVYNLDGKDVLLSVSCCVAAPLPGDDLDDLIDNLYIDLDKQVKDRGSVLTYQELSPLERFMKEKE